MSVNVEKMEEEEEEDQVDDTVIDGEVLATERVINAFFYYKTYGRKKLEDMQLQFRILPVRHQVLIERSYKEHMKSLEGHIEHNHTIIRMIINFGSGMFGEETQKALRITQLRRPPSEYMSKVMSTLRQITREWSREGESERMATYEPIMMELGRIYPMQTTRRQDVRILVPGCGLGRLAYDMIEEGFTVQGNEFSLYMLMTSCFILNACRRNDQFTLYPYLFDRSNSWEWNDQLRPITFPDKCPTIGDRGPRQNSFSMGGGDFMDASANVTFDVIVTAWFIDTAHNILEYIDRIYECLELNGTWINVGPLTYHYENMKGEASIELPYSEVIRLVREKGFIIEVERKIESFYTVNRTSMLQNKFNCAFFTARKFN